MKTEWRKTAWLIRTKTGRVVGNHNPHGDGLPGLYATLRAAKSDAPTDSSIERVEIIVRSMEAHK